MEGRWELLMWRFGRLREKRELSLIGGQHQFPPVQVTLVRWEGSAIDDWKTRWIQRHIPANSRYK